MKPLLPLFKLMKAFTGWIILSILMGTAAIGSGIGLLGTSSWLIASAALHPSIAELQVAIVGVRFFGISRGVFRYLERLISHSVNLHLLSRLREDFYQRIEPRAPANLRTYRSGDLLHRMMGDLETLENFYVRVAAPVVVAVVIAVGTSLFIGGFLAECGIILAAGLFTNGFLLPVFTLFTSRPWVRELTNVQAEASALTVESLQGLEDLQAYHAHDRWFAVLQENYRQAGKIQSKITAINATGSAFSLLILNCTVLGVVWAAIPLVSAGELDGVMLAVLAMVTSASFEAVSVMPAASVNLNASISSAKRLFNVGGQILETKPFDRENPVLSGGEVIFSDISLVYPDAPQPALKGISFSLYRGEKKAVVGDSGAGKTSLLNLLMRFYTPASGNIIVDGIDLQQIDPASLHSIFGVVPQSLYLFNASLRKNLQLARPGAEDKALQEALEKAGLGKWAWQLPDGLDTWLGENGVKMSAGERQRLAVARVILQDPPVLLLDEPTANLDQVNEARILDNLFTIFQDRTILLITHRLSLLEKMDEILVMNSGEIVERGKYFDLLACEGKFKRMVDFENDVVVENDARDDSQ